MICVYRSLGLQDVMHYRNLLAERGIACHVRNYHSASVLGELPFLEVAPELCVLDPRDVDLAQRVIATAGVPTATVLRDWTRAATIDVDDPAGVVKRAGDRARADVGRIVQIHARAAGHQHGGETQAGGN